MSKKFSRESKSVAHHSPGRTRLKVPKAHRRKLHEIKSAIASHPGVTSVEVNHSTGSVLVHHDHETPIFEVLHKTIETVGTDLLTTLIEGEAAPVVGGIGV
ncbi:MAG: heavy-metal-associated domain-containing protein, partial [Candidatus Obscuribacterales bacterium]|nr:heavy-metal-associated domain-containing protein [Candidatus Obscuribacterales bacterium]